MKKNILVILMTNGKNSKLTKKYIKKFKIAFNNNAILIFKMWYEKDLYFFIKNNNIDGIILSGSEYRILNTKKHIAKIPLKIIKLRIPILGICYGYQWLIRHLCGKKCINSFNKNKLKKYYKLLKINNPIKLKKNKLFFTHHDYIINIPKKWNIDIKYKHQIWSAYNKKNKIIGVQFHPELSKSSKEFYRKWLNYIS